MTVCVVIRKSVGSRAPFALLLITATLSGDSPRSASRRPTNQDTFLTSELTTLPPLPDEVRRRQTLRSFDLPEKPLNPRFDAYVDIAARLCRAPMAMLSVVGDDRHWVKASVGLREEQLPREHTFCALAIANPQETMVVSDATNDRRFCDNPFVRHNPGVRFYAGVPLVVEQGLAIGTLCVLDTTPRTLDSTQQGALELLAGQVCDRLVLEREHRRLLNANEQLEDFAYSAAHDLRAPLRHMQQFSNLLGQEHGGVLDDEGHRFLAYIQNSAGRLQDLVETLLTYARVGRNEATEEAVAVGVVLSETLSMLRPTIEEARAELVVHGALPRVLGQPPLLRELFQNLIENALKYRAEHRAPRIRIEARRDGVFDRFSISDNGVGIAADQLERIFEPFQRLRTVTTGSGFGLTHCRKIVELHGGRIWADSRPGEGSTFHFTLPRA